MLLEGLDSFDVVIVVYGGLPDSRFVLQKSFERMASFHMRYLVTEARVLSKIKQGVNLMSDARKLPKKRI